jgi:hypothetical protein
MGKAQRISTGNDRGRTSRASTTARARISSGDSRCSVKLTRSRKQPRNDVDPAIGDLHAKIKVGGWHGPRGKYEQGKISNSVGFSLGR